MPEVETTFQVSEFVAVFNQTLEYAYPRVRIEGEVSSYRVSKGKWVYFDLKDEQATVRFFGSVFSMTTPLEDGMKVIVTGSPRLHQLYGFTVNVQSVELSGQGTIRRAFELLKKKLNEEGLFEESRKRPLPTFPKRIGLITSEQSAAYADFMKIINERWGGLSIQLADVQVQGEPSPGQIVSAIEYFNQQANPVDVVVITRGGGSMEDLQSFSTETVTRAVAASRIPTLVAIGHEVDTSLAELAADRRAATPTNAAQVVVPNASEVAHGLDRVMTQLSYEVEGQLTEASQRIDAHLHHMQNQLRLPRERVDHLHKQLVYAMQGEAQIVNSRVVSLEKQLETLDPRLVLKRGYSLLRNQQGDVVKTAAMLHVGDTVMVELSAGNAKAEVTDVEK